MLISEALLHKARIIHLLVRSHLSHVDPDDGGGLVLASELLKSCSKAGQGGLSASINLRFESIRVLKRVKKPKWGSIN